MQPLRIPRMNSRMMAQPFQIHAINNLGLGLNDQMDASQINDAEIADCENFSVEEGTLATAPGYIGWDDAPQSHPGPYWGGFMFKKSTGYMVDIRQRQDKLEYDIDGAGHWLPCNMPTTGSPAKTVTLTQDRCTFAHLNDICVFTNGYESVMSSTDGITWTIQASLPKSKVVFANAKNRLLFLAQTGTNRQYRIDWTDINSPLTIQSSSYQLLDPNNNGVIVGAGLTPEGTTLVFKESAVYTVADIVDNGMIDINFIAHATCFAHASIATTHASVIWAGFSAVYEYIGGQVRNIFGRINPNGRNDVLRSNLYCGVFYNNKYHLALPDATISQDYNAQEYVFYLNIARNDAVQPYAITRNRRYIGCYWIEDMEYDYGRDITLYFGDSRPVTTSGSPAQYDNTVFAWINDYRDTKYTQGGLDGSPQDCYFVTKYFTDNVPFYVKKYKKLFAYMKLFQNTSITVSYRFVPYGSWTDATVDVLTNPLSFLEGYGFSEGYSFSQDTLGTVFVDLNGVEKPRGIQFKLAVSTTKDISYLSLAYSHLTKPKFK